MHGINVHKAGNYLGDPDWPAPNLVLLNNALRQTDWPGEPLTAASWRVAVRQRLEGVAWDPVVADVRPFLAPSADAGLLTRENVLRVLKQDDDEGIIRGIGYAETNSPAQ